VTASEHELEVPRVGGPASSAEVPLDLRVRAWFRVEGWLRALGYYPTMADIPSVTLAKRKARKPPWWMTLPLPADVQVEDHPAPSLGLPIAVRAYRPTGVTGALPIVMFTHGGGFVNCGLDAMQFLCASVASTARALVVSVDYPLAPESPFPDALDAGYETLCWLAEHGAQLGGDATSLMVMGDSAGGNLAAALCLLARRNGTPHVARQVLIYPRLDATLSTPRMQAESAKRRNECNTFYSYYAGRHARTDELISPLLAANLSGLPPALVITAEHDSLQDDGRVYAERLREAGVPVRYTNYLGMPHGFLSMPRLCRAAPQAVAEIAHELRRPITD
jgi:acetyl esterase/lipase